MNICKEGIALIAAGNEANLGKLVYVVGTWLHENLPAISGDGEPRWEVQMISTPLSGDQGEDLFGGSIYEGNLLPLEIPTQLAKSMREEAVVTIIEGVIADLEAEETLMSSNAHASSGFFVTDAPKYRLKNRGVRVCEIPQWCAQKLVQRGLAEPVPFASLAGKFWWVQMDMAAKDDRYEPGCGTVNDVASTERIADVMTGYFIKVMAGPFDTKAQAHYASGAAPEGPDSVDQLVLNDSVEAPARELAMPDTASALIDGNEEYGSINLNSEIPVHLSRLPNVLEQLAKNGSEASWAVFMFYTSLPSRLTDDHVINLQYSIENGVLGLDWVLLGERNIADKEALSKFIAGKGYVVSENEGNGVCYLRVEGDDLADLGKAIALELYKIGKNYQLGLLCDGFCYRPPNDPKH